MRRKQPKTAKEVASVPVTAPKPPTDGRPSLAEAKQVVRSTLKNQGKTEERPGEVANQEKGLVYYYWDALDVGEARKAKLRILLASRGYWKTEGDEYVPHVPHAEIWATYVEVKKQLDRDTKRRHDRLKRSVTGQVS
jgi:hypothetical protein